MNNTDTLQAVVDTAKAVVEAAVPAVASTNDSLVSAVTANTDKVLTLGEALQSQSAVIVIFGVMVTIVLILIAMVQWRMLSVLQGMSAGKVSGAQAPAAVAQAPVAAAPTTLHPGLSDEKLFAIITAAVVHALGENVKVVSFKPTDTSNWTNQGRSDLHSQRKVA